MEGWVSIHRKIMDKHDYFSEPFCRNMAWIDLVLLANHEKNFFRCRGVKVEVKRGQIGYGIEKISLRWKWSRGKVERWMKELEKDNQIVRQKNNITTLISIVNYNKYQDGDNADNKTNSKANGKANSKPDGHQTVKQTDINNNDNNDNNGNNINNGKVISIEKSSEINIAPGEVLFEIENLENPVKFPTWRDEAKEFLADEYLIQQYIRNKKLQRGVVIALMREFVIKLNLGGDFKKCSGIKIHFQRSFDLHYGNKIPKTYNQGSISNAFIEVPKDFDYGSVKEGWD